MALLQPKFDTGSILVVGDGNFSFSLCLAEALVGRAIGIFASSLDPRSSLEDDQTALDNLRKLASFRNVTVLHEVDGTNLAVKFESKRFRRIIFNFPHVGGKSKISLARLLLERFFRSAAGHIEADGGDICVSLCQGQGGTPADNPARDYGNTWQVVSQAAKAGLILNAVWPFHGDDYPHYLSAGFRGRLGQGFHTKGGLTHKFIQAIPLSTIPDLQTFLGQQDLPGCHGKLQSLPAQHPVYLLKEKLDEFFDNCIGAPFQTVDPELLTNEAKSCETTNHSKDVGTPEVGRVVQGTSSNNANRMSNSLTSSSEMKMKSEQCFHERIHQCLIKTQGSFSLMDVVVDHSKPICRTSYPISHKMAVVCVKDSNTEIEKELTKVLSDLTRDIFPNLQVAGSQRCCAKSNGLSLEAHKRVERLADGTYRVHSSNTGCSCDSSDLQCIFCRLEAHYLGLHQETCSATHLDKFIDLPTLSDFYHQDTFLLSYGLLRDKVEQLSEPKGGWMIVINLDNVLRAVCEIPDARLLWSCDPKLLKQFCGSQGDASDNLQKFMPFSLYAPSHTHDISFWLTEVATEKKFFEAIFKTTQDCVADVIFRERYHDKEQGLVSYNYRMIFSRCDGPLTHLQAVEMQNLLRRYLMSCGFGLK